MSQPSSPKLINLTLRDGQQSTLDSSDWIFEPREYGKIIAASRKAGFHGAEIAGGQSFQMAIGCGYNPFTLLGAISHAVKNSPEGNGFVLQMLFRGANALGFRHYDKDLVEVTLREFIKYGITKIRFFDALNDIQNLDLPESIQDTEGVTFEGAICFTHYADHPERYSDAYFCRYAEALLEAGYNAIAIKDMSGQLTAERVSTLLPALLDILNPKDIPLALHCHSTNEQNSRDTIARAIELGVHAVETSEGCLSGGSAHHALSAVAPELVTNQAAYRQLTRKTDSLWKNQPSRKDQEIPQALKEQLCAAGVPGGAMPFVIRDLQQQEATIRAKFASSTHTAGVLATGADINEFSTIVDLFIGELKRVCQDAGLPLLVTPTADICCKQAIANLAIGADPYSDSLADRYLNRGGQPNPDSRFAKLILGYYGELKAYDVEGTVHGASEEVTRFFEANNSLQLKVADCHPSENLGGDDLRTAQRAAWKLIYKKGADALSFASFDQLTILYALKPTIGAQSDDPVAKAVDIYRRRAENARIDGFGRTFPGYETLMRPVLSALGAMFALNPTLDALDIPELPLEKLGNNLCNQLFDIYIDLPIWADVIVLDNHLSKLLTSCYISDELRKAVGHVSESLDLLDLRPSHREAKHLPEVFGRFKAATIGELFDSLAMINAFVNDVAKYATNPTTYAERAISISDISRLQRPATAGEQRSAWEEHIRQSLNGKHLRLEADFQRRAAYWKA